MDGNDKELEIVEEFGKVKIRPLMDGNKIQCKTNCPITVKIRPLMDGNYILFSFISNQ